MQALLPAERLSGAGAGCQCRNEKPIRMLHDREPVVIFAFQFPAPTAFPILDFRHGLPPLDQSTWPYQERRRPLSAASLQKNRLITATPRRANPGKVCSASATTGFSDPCPDSSELATHGSPLRFCSETPHAGLYDSVSLYKNKIRNRPNVRTYYVIY